ncbi:hypothetical protein E3P81_01868 [Wallemia ichthyophaga]|nr:hypothetical protein E3P97_01867 [Wallemia ichthyophaga]TIB30621.1 hypothetical protein E3P85_02659 [Wallemia ichthyophaga]TIB47044.1 hypothetical protein E3P82_01882 [Wallemia ichthyophaga]TIB51336.1 hypothetical protein E3P81_01868 [Wallemia ichthyophaga]TIB54109.1 hypothetical protein E3P80_01883 [Wallemia ichthyophaga]
MEILNIKGAPSDTLFSPLSEYNNQLHSPPEFHHAHPDIFYNEIEDSHNDSDQLVSQLALIQAHQHQIHSNQLLLNRQLSQPTQQPVQSTEDSSNGPSMNNRKLGLYKTELCRSWEEKGTCRYGSKCQFAHGQDELRQVPRHPKFKTQLCATYWHSGACPYGKRCCFIHSTFPHAQGAIPPMPLSIPMSTHMSTSDEESPQTASAESTTFTASPRQSYTQSYSHSHAPSLHSLTLTPNTSISPDSNEQFRSCESYKSQSPCKNAQTDHYTPSLLSRIGERQRAGSTPSLSTSVDSNLSSPPPMSKTSSLNSFQFSEAPIYGLGLGFTTGKYDDFGVGVGLGYKNSI